MLCPPREDVHGLYPGYCTPAARGFSECSKSTPQVSTLPANQHLFKVDDALSNQRPLPCEGSVIVCLRFLEFAKSLQMVVFLR
jgi:hypothetical protein